MGVDSEYHKRSLSEDNALSVGDVVRSTITPELKGKIVWRGPVQARVELLTFPTDWWETWGKRPVPVLIENLKLVKAMDDG